MGCCLSLGAAQAQPSYQQPSAAVREALAAPLSPRMLVSPDRRLVAALELQRYARLADLARPQLRLAGLRIDARSATPIALQGIAELRLKALQADAPERRIELPAGGLWHGFAWSPDGLRFLLERRTEQANELWVGDAASGRLRQIHGLRLNNTLAEGDQAWLSAREVVMLAVPRDRGAAPTRAATVPVVQENLGRASPERTYPDLLRSPLDEALFEYHTRSRPVRVDLVSGQWRELAAPAAMYSSLSGVGEGQALLLERVGRPFSYSLQWNDFPTHVELRAPDGKLIRELARMPLKQGVAIDGALPGPRVFYAAPTRDAAIYWVEALDGGNPATRAAYRDRVMRLDPPYTGDPFEVQRMPHRFSRLRFLDDGQHALLTEEDRSRAWLRTYLLPLRGTQSRLLFEHSVRERYRHPGTPLMRTLPGGGQAVQTLNGDPLLVGQGAGPRGERPFLDRVSVRDGSTQRLFQSADGVYELPLALLGERRAAAGQMPPLLLTRESPTEPPSLQLREAGHSTVLLRGQDLLAALKRVRRETVSFKRSDGVELSFTLALPPDYKDGERRPTLVWAYPQEFNEPALAAQQAGPSNRYPQISAISPLLLALDGYVVLNDATMPIVGDSRSMNDGFIEQVMMNARAILDKAEELGVTDPRRVAVGGHSYGAFMATNLLAHTRLFRCGIARSGAYNRTLTPFGYQSERRSLWEAKATYLRVSPFLFAHQIREPLLLIHGEADNNSGTYPMQSERLYQALAGLGGTVRYVLLPNEGHGYQARESAGHVQWEMQRWLRGCLGDPRADNGKP